MPYQPTGPLSRRHIVCLDDRLYDAINGLSLRDGVPFSEVVRELCAAALQDRERAKKEGEKMSWTPEMQAILAELGPTTPASVIAERLGVTRNAVIGRAHRTGVPLMNGRIAQLQAYGGSPTHYPCGHPRTPENTFTYWQKGYKSGGCRECNLSRSAAYRKRKALLRNREVSPKLNTLQEIVSDGKEAG